MRLAFILIPRGCICVSNLVSFPDLGSPLIVQSLHSQYFFSPLKLVVEIGNEVTCIYSLTGQSDNTPFLIKTL